MCSSQESSLSLAISILLAGFSIFCPSAAAVSISVSPKTLIRSNRTVVIRWSGVPSPSSLDWVGIYSPPDSSDDHFIGYLFLNSSPSWPSGSGELRIPLVNLRSNYAFRLFRWKPEEVNYRHHDHDHNPLPGTRHRLAQSEEVGFEHPAAPEQLHLSFTDRGDEMRVMFVTGYGKEEFVRYGLDETMDRIVGTKVTRYERKDMCDSPANSSLGWRDPGFIHSGSASKGVCLLHAALTISIILPSFSYRKYYPIVHTLKYLNIAQVGSDASGWGETYSFISRDNEANETIAFLFGDMGTSVPYATFYRAQEESKSTVQWILRDLKNLGNKPAFISHIGDISYARGFSWIWDEFFNLIEPIASRVPYHVCIGNHEYDWPLQPWRPGWSWGVYGTDGGGECGVPYSLKFTMPGNSSFPTGTGAPDTRNLYFSFDAGVVHFLYISTETDFMQGSDQYNFIKHDLENVDRTRTPFIVVQGHRPMYTTSNEIRDAPMRERMLDHLEPLLVENNVTLALWGHVHRYERFCSLRNYSCVDASSYSNSGSATVHVVIGMAGQDWQASWKPRPDHTDLPIFPQPKQSMYRGGEFGYTKLVATREKLTLTYIGNHDGEVHDVVEIQSGLITEVGSHDFIVVSEPKLSWYVQGAGILMLGAFIGYVLGFVTRCKRDAAPRNTWTPVKSEEM
ncbi:putative inactive purple acid phosphatase 2 [Apostasia shenzhenica]|uniref:Purple acid phosphatase n=1 Tax=Apostasia shenzhenica TaxID=1088818 RepID=A0A2I0B9H4_9ASPA|nr:putative inactive purple acid phosphatase 2 [Apostasia shenzhenica]